MSYDELPIPDVTDATSLLRDHLTREPSAAMASAAVVAFAIGVEVILRYAPEYIRVLGGGPVVIGLFGSTALLIALGYPRIDAVSHIGANYRAATFAALATLGLLVWLLAPGLAVAGHAAWPWMVVGLGLLGAWVLTRGDAGFTLGVIPHESYSGSINRTHENAPERREIWPAGWIGLLVGFVVVGLFLSVVPTFLAGFRVVLAVLVTGGLCVTVFLAADGLSVGTDSPSGSDELEDSSRMQGVRARATTHRQQADADTGTDEREDASDDAGHDGSVALDLTAALGELRSLPADRRRLLLGETLVRVAAGMVSVFVVVVITTVLEADATVLGVSLPPAAFFGVLVAIEVAVAGATLGRARWIEDRIGSEPLAATSLLIVALFPILLVSAPARSLALGVVFALLGVRAVGLPARRSLIAEHLHDSATNASYRLVRDAAVVPSALLSGILYAVSPTLAFGLATAVGLLGVREFLWFLRGSANDDPA